VHAANKRQTHILDAHYKAADLKEIIKCIGKNNLLKLFIKYAHLFVGTLGNFENI
jgi:hypothetical protein